MDLREEVMYEIFLDLYKSYDTLDHDRCLDILAVGGLLRFEKNLF